MLNPKFPDLIPRPICKKRQMTAPRQLSRRGAWPRRPRWPARIGVYPVLQETVGHVHWPLGEIVTPQLLPLPFGLATS